MFAKKDLLDAPLRIDLSVPGAKVMVTAALWPEARVNVGTLRLNNAGLSLVSVTRATAPVGEVFASLWKITRMALVLAGLMMGT